MLKPLLSTTLLTCFIMFNKLSLVQSKLCYFYPKDTSDNVQDFTTICSDDCCFLKAETENDACCSGISSVSFWYIPIFSVFGISLLLTFVLLTYIFICKRQKIRNVNRVGGANRSRNGHYPNQAGGAATIPSAPENIYQTMVAANTIKPSSTLSIIQEMDCTRLPSYSEATKMKSESPPDYRQLFSSSKFLR